VLLDAWGWSAVTGLAVLAWLFFQAAKPTQAQSREPFHRGLWVRHFTDVAEVWRNPLLWRATMGICFFYGVAGYITLLIPQIAFEMQGGGAQTSAVWSTMLLMVGAATANLRGAPNGEERLKEAAHHGFLRAIVPKANAPKKARVGEMEVIGVERLAEAIDACR
jgi:hypothetical protein